MCKLPSLLNIICARLYTNAIPCGHCYLGCNMAGGTGAGSCRDYRMRNLAGKEQQTREGSNLSERREELEERGDKANSTVKEHEPSQCSTWHSKCCCMGKRVPVILNPVGSRVMERKRKKKKSRKVEKKEKNIFG